MTQHNEPDVPVVGGVPVHTLLGGSVPELLPRVLERIKREVPDYRRLPAEELRGDIAGITRDALRAFVRSLREQRPLGESELLQVSASAARRAEEGFPLEAVLAAYHVGVREIFAFIAAQASEGDLPALAATADQVLRFLGAISGAVTSGYLDELRTKLGQEHDSRRTLLSALLAGEPVEAVARAERYLVLTVTLGRHADEGAPTVDTAIAVRRKLRRFLATFEQVCAAPVLASMEGAGGIVLLPLTSGVSEVDWTNWRAVVGRAAQAAGAPVTAAGEDAAAQDVPGAAARTGEVLDVLSWFGREPGLYRIDDVLVEYQLTRPGAARDRLAALLAPLERHPDLLTTLECYLAQQVNRRRTAAALHIHPNTVDYRLRRVQQLTGVDPVQPAGLPRMLAAVAARRAGSGTGRRGAGISGISVT
ncbi:PucR family transcriptional regulator [Amycolatopsis sp. H20-H5]|uniref:PucR family transcriptional regulator n=1 Tax=Amycolatopsis sp. H20-H5 TaxID=3046309 RepID=UPI002DBED30F|nr:helix-turn-helix domain-containing protein [Amycolatopsis sp. H20-H5]MEC3979180.1 helix-turn-helix domain-containing protein [Amycolatopsis sp. H20-H5]